MPNLNTPRILWAALLFSQVLYFGLLAAPGLLERPTTPAEPALFWPIALVAVVVAVTSWVLPAVFWRNAFRGSAPLDTQPLEGGAQSAAYRAEMSARGFVDPQKALTLALQRGFTPFILGVALNESVALFGFVLGFLGHSLLTVLPFFLTAWLMMLPRFPTERMFLRPLARAQGVEI